jgi:hypothetical protein
LYQDFVHGVGVALAHDKKYPWLPLHFYVKSYNFKDIKEAVAESKNLATFHYGEDIFRRHDPLDFVIQHYRAFKYRWSYQSEVWHKDELYIRVVSLDEVNFRMAVV